MKINAQWVLEDTLAHKRCTTHSWRWKSFNQDR